MGASATKGPKGAKKFELVGSLYKLRFSRFPFSKVSFCKVVVVGEKCGEVSF